MSHLPTVHRFDNTTEAYGATQCRDDIRDGDVLVIERGGVVGFLVSAWPVAVTALHGELHSPLSTWEGHYAESAAHAEQIARELGFPLPADVPDPAAAGEPAQTV